MSISHIKTLFVQNWAPCGQMEEGGGPFMHLLEAFMIFRVVTPIRIPLYFVQHRNLIAPSIASLSQEPLSSIFSPLSTNKQRTGTKRRNLLRCYPSIPWPSHGRLMVNSKGWNEEEEGNSNLKRQKVNLMSKKRCVTLGFKQQNQNEFRGQKITDLRSSNKWYMFK